MRGGIWIYASLLPPMASVPNHLETDSDSSEDTIPYRTNSEDEATDAWWDTEEQHHPEGEDNNNNDLHNDNHNGSANHSQDQSTRPLSDDAAGSPRKPQPGFDEAAMRKLIMQIQKDTTMDRKEKARLMQHVMSHGTLPSKAALTAPATDETAPKKAYVKSYNNQEKGILGCKHYQRNVKLQADCCQQIFSCRFCHDDASDHAIIRQNTKNMLCMECMTLQPAAQTCRECGTVAAQYYCDKCKLWDNDPNKSIYHCDDCGICRQGRGLGDDFFHCKKCNVCMGIAMKDKHRCIERNLESDCPICGEYMFTSTTTVIFMPCGHCIHKLCYTAYIQTAYQCPTCLKSLRDMSEYFSRLDMELERQTMPPEYEKFVSHIFCNDCEKKSPAKYHFFYHKCAHCGSYNTTVLKTENTEETGQQPLPDSTGAPEAPPSGPPDNSDQGIMRSSASRNGAIEASRDNESSHSIHSTSSSSTSSRHGRDN